jgi:recombination DNA repair RAD52 pathway protein
MLSKRQHDILLRPLNPTRIENRSVAGMKLSYLAQHDVRAHLIRVFGFGNFDLRTIKSEMLFCDKTEKGSWDASWLVTMELTVRDLGGDVIAIYSESAVGSNTQGRRAEALDMALKTASSDAMKRCAINLGDQFGLSLYDNGSTDPIVRATLVDDSFIDPVTHALLPDGDEVGSEGMPVGDPKGEAEGL